MASGLVKLRHLQKTVGTAKAPPTSEPSFTSRVNRKEVPVLKIPKFFQCEKELLHRPQVRDLHEAEAQQMQNVLMNLFSGKLEVTLKYLQKQLEQGKISEDAIDQHLRYYLRKGNIATYRMHLLFLTYTCLKQARLERTKEKQIPLLFKAIDLLRIYIQYTDEALDMMASSIIVHIFSVFPPAFDEKLELEREVFQSYAELFKTKRKTAKYGFGEKDNVSERIKIARLYAQQKNYYDAFVQFSKTLEIFQYRSDDDPQALLNRARSHAWIGSIFQEMIHYAQAGQATILNTFIYRYNRDYATRKNPHPITVLRRNDAIAMRQTKKDIIRLANDQYKAVEEIGDGVHSVGYQVTEAVLAGLNEAKLRPHLLKALKTLKEQIFGSREEFFEKLEELAKPPPNDAQAEKIWQFVSSDAKNVSQYGKLQLRRNNKWIEVYSESMIKLAKNYEFLQMGDATLKYAQKAYSIVQPFSDRRYTAQKRSLLGYVKEVSESSRLSFAHTSKSQRNKAVQEVRSEMSKMNEASEKQNRQRHLVANKTLARASETVR